MVTLLLWYHEEDDNNGGDSDDDDDDELWLLLLDCPIYNTPDRSASEKHNKNKTKKYWIIPK